MLTNLVVTRYFLFLLFAVYSLLLFRLPFPQPHKQSLRKLSVVAGCLVRGAQLFSRANFGKHSLSRRCSRCLRAPQPPSSKSSRRQEERLGLEETSTRIYAGQAKQ